MQVKLGDIFEIPFNEQSALCKVIWMSNEYEDCFGFVVYSKLNDINQSKDVKDIKSIPIYSGDVKVLYADTQNLCKSIWPIVGNRPITTTEKELTLHNIAGNLYLGDEFIRELTNDEINNYPKYLLAGNEAVLTMLRNAFSV